MTLTTAQRRRINRQNARKSTGPRSDEGKGQSRLNALKHGLRAEVVPLPGDDPAEVEARVQVWNDYYQPDSPAAQHLVNECVQATLLAERTHRYHAAALSRQVRAAETTWDEQRVDELERLKTLLKDDPATAARQLRRTGHGCRWLIERWERLEQMLEEKGCWFGPDRDEAIRLLGFRPDVDQLVECPEAYLTRLFNLLCNPSPSDQALEWLCNPKQMPESVRSLYRIDWLPDRDDCLKSLRDMIAEQLEPLREAEERLREQHDDPDRAEAADRALILDDDRAARLFLRYHAESRTAFHRAYGVLLKTLERDEQTAADPTPAASQPPAAPAPLASESTPTEVVVAVSPNEANPAGEPDSTSMQKTTSDEPESAVSGPSPAPARGESGPRTDAPPQSRAIPESAVGEVVAGPIPTPGPCPHSKLGIFRSLGVSDTGIEPDETRHSRQDFH